MSRSVVISKLAARKLEKLFEFLAERWSPKVKSDFIKKMDKAISVLVEHPESFPESEQEKGLRRCVVTKQTTLFYRFDDKQIKIVTVFDTRQNPISLNKDLS